MLGSANFLAVYPSAVLQPLEGGKKVKVTGSIGLKMTDFKITPPKPKIALGLLTVDDDIKVSFEWMTARSEKK